MGIKESFLNQLQQAVKEDDLEIPSLPEVSLKVRAMAEDPNVTSDKLASTIGHDVGISAKLIKMANGPLNRGTVPVDNLKMAITRLGLTSVRNIVTGLAMQQMFQATDDFIDEQLRKTWKQSTKVAAISHALTKKYTKLTPDVAALGGLMHQIGVLPILLLAEENGDILRDPNGLSLIINEMQQGIGTSVLTQWKFPNELVAIPENYLNTSRNPDKPLDYVDIVLIANTQLPDRANTTETETGGNEIPAFKKLNLTPNVNVYEIEELQEELQAAEELWC